MLDIPYLKLAVLGIFAVCTTQVHRRGSVCLGFWRQLSDHSTFMAPIHCVMYLFSGEPNRPFPDTAAFPQLRLLEGHATSDRTGASMGHLRTFSGCGCSANGSRRGADSATNC